MESPRRRNLRSVSGDVLTPRYNFRHVMHFLNARSIILVGSSSESVEGSSEAWDPMSNDATPGTRRIRLNRHRCRSAVVREPRPLAVYGMIVNFIGRSTPKAERIVAPRELHDAATPQVSVPSGCKVRRCPFCWLLPMSFAVLLTNRTESIAFIFALVLLLL